MKSGFGRFRYGLYQVCNTQTLQTKVNQMLRFAHGLGLVCIHTDALHVPREKPARVVQIVFTQKLTGALQQVNMCAHPVMSCRTHAGPKGISNMVEAGSTSAGQGHLCSKSAASAMLPLVV